MIVNCKSNNNLFKQAYQRDNQNHETKLFRQLDNKADKRQQEVLVIANEANDIAKKANDLSNTANKSSEQAEKFSKGAVVLSLVIGGISALASFGSLIISAVALSK
jgi:hypothetical protein